MGGQDDGDTLGAQPFDQRIEIELAREVRGERAIESVRAERQDEVSDW